MGFWNSLFNSETDEDRVRTRQEKADLEHQRGDQYTFTEDDKHVHRSYDLNTTTGEYREYSGGENAHDRNYNK